MKKGIRVLILLLFVLIVGCSQQSNESSSTDTTSNEGSNEQGAQEEGTTDDSYPNKPIEVIVPYDAGGTTDIIARLLAEHATKHLPNEQQIVIVNKSGANGAVGTTSLMQSEPDGYTIGISDVSALNIRPHVDDSVSFTHDSFQMIMQVANVPQLLVTRNDSPFETIDDWFESVSGDEKLFIGTSGFGGLQHLVVQQVDNVTDNPIEMIQFDGSAGVITGVLSNEVEVGVAGVPNALNNDDIRPLINTGSERSKSFPDLPTLKESGLDVEGDLYFGILAPKGVSQDKVQILDEAFKKALEESEVQSQLDNMGYEILYRGPEDFQKAITDSYNRFGNVLKEAGVIE